MTRSPIFAFSFSFSASNWRSCRDGWSARALTFAAILFSPPFDQASRNLILACGLGHRYLPGLDLFDHLAFEFGFELSTDFSHFEYRCPLRPAQKRLAREAVENATSDGNP